MAKSPTYYVARDPSGDYVSVTLNKLVANVHSATKFTQTKIREFERRGTMKGMTFTPVSYS